VVIDYPPAWRARFEAAPPNGLPCGNYTPDYLHMGRFFQAPAQPFDVHGACVPAPGAGWLGRKHYNAWLARHESSPMARHDFGAEMYI
jgi:hypothetical protein